MKNNLITLLFLILLFTSCSLDDSFQSVDSDSYGKLTGVVKLSNGENIEGVNVYTQPPFKEVLTDNFGRFEFEGIPPNTYIVFANKDGYKTSNVTAKVVAAYKTNIEIIIEKGVDEHNAPIKPFNPKPVDKSIVSRNETIKLSWDCSSPDGYELSYDVYFGKDVIPQNLIADDLKEKSFTISGLDFNSPYYWKVVATDSKGVSTSSEVWSFKFARLPNKPFNLKPVNNAIVSNNVVEFSWDCTHPDLDKMTYEIYFSDANTDLKRIYGPKIENHFIYSDLVDNKYYKWKVVAYDSFGGKAESEVQFFTTNFQKDVSSEYAYYPFDGNTNDYSGNSRNAIANNIFFDSDRFGKAQSSAYFFGTEKQEFSYIEVDRKRGQFAFDGDFTIALWVKPNLKSSRAFNTHIHIIGQTDLNSNWWSLGFTQQLGLEYWSAIDNSPTFIGYDHITLKDNVWNHIAVVFVKNKTNNIGTAFLYLNGKLLGEKPLINKMANPQASLRIGYFNHNSLFSGWIDDLYFFTKALTDVEILKLAQ